MPSKIKSTPLIQAIAERTGVLSEKQIENYIEEVSKNDLVLESLMIGADRKLSMSLSPKDHVKNAMIGSCHASSYLQLNGLPDKGLQDLQQAQHKFAIDRLKETKKNG